MKNSKPSGKVHKMIWAMNAMHISVIVKELTDIVYEVSMKRKKSGTAQ